MALYHACENNTNNNNNSMLSRYKDATATIHPTNEWGGGVGGGGKFLKKLWCCVGEKYNKIVWFNQLG